MPEARRWLEGVERTTRAEVLAWLWETQAEAVVVHDADGRVLDANRAACDLLAVGLSAMVGTLPSDPLWRRIERVEGGALAVDELPAAPRAAPVLPLRDRLLAIRAPGAPEVIARVRADRRRTGSGEVLTLVTFVDVTNEARAEREAQAARRHVERISEAVEEFLFTTKLQPDGTLRLEYVGPGMERLLGGQIPPERTPEAAWFGAMHPDDRPIGQDALRRSAAGDPVTIEYRMVGLDGRTRWVRTTTTMRVDAGGTFFDGVATDITEARRRTVELERFRAIVEASRGCIALLDDHWRLRWMNRAGLLLTSLEAGAVPGMPFEQLVAEEAREEHLRDERAAVERDGHWHGESVMRPVDLERRPVRVEATTYAIDDPATGESLGLVVMRSDIGELRHLAREHEAIGNVATVVASGADQETVFATTCREVARVLEADAAGIAQALGGDPPELLLASSWPEGYDVRGTLRSALASAARRAAPEERTVAFAVAHHDCVGARVRVEGETWGFVAACRERVAFGTEDARALARLADLVGAAVELGRARSLLVERATTDGLTGLYNHRTFHEHLQDEVARARRYGRPSALVLIDLDEFKAVNDRHGHQRGDRLLRAVADALRAEVRGTELVARLGGDEFALLLPETDLLGAEEAAERVRAAIDALPDAREHGVTASAGVAELTQAETADELFRLADGALYWSKVHGRNRVSAYDPGRVEALSAQERAERLARSHALGAVRVLARLIDLKDASTHQHSERVAELAVLLARELGWPEERRALLRDAALVHDVGKVIVPEALLSKPGALTPEEYEVVKRHAPTGAQIAAEALNEEQATWIRQHHERPDGGGYPDGIGAPELTEGACILSLADCWDVMTSDRPYREAKPAAAALDECRALVARQFDGRVLEAFEALWSRGDVPIP